MSEIEGDGMAFPVPIKVDIKGDLTKPAEILINKLSDAFGKLYEPIYLVKIAKAKSEIKMIEAQTDQALQDRATSRFLAVESRNQKNIESIIEKAIHELEEEADPSKMDDDWINQFFEKARFFSDEEMQALWAKVLSGEANKPSSYSLRTIDFISTMSKTEAKQFRNLCSSVWSNLYNKPIIMSLDTNTLLSLSLNYEKMLHLEDIGLIHINSNGYALEVPTLNFPVSYYGKQHIIKSPGNDNNFSMGKVVFTQIGTELLKISAPEPKWDYYNFTIDHFKKKNILA